MRTNLAWLRKKVEQFHPRFPTQFELLVWRALYSDLRPTIEFWMVDLAPQGAPRDPLRWKLGEVQAFSRSTGLQRIALLGAPLAVKRALYQLSALIRKFPSEGDDSLRRETARKKFLAYERHCAGATERLRKLRERPVDDRMRRIFEKAAMFIEQCVGSKLPESDEMLEWSRHGPGAAVGFPMRRSSSFFKYYDVPYTVTEAALGLAKFAIRSDERWMHALSERYLMMTGRNTFPLDETDFWAWVLRVVPANKVTFVPKDAQTERTIAIEPSINLYLQLGLDGYIRTRLKRYGVDLDSQEKNQLMAREGSWTGNFVTMDLEGASDTVSQALIEFLCPEWLTRYIAVIRSPQGELDGTRFDYFKTSSMGNGATFALESLIFTAFVRAVISEGSRPYLERYAVYGDDIVIGTRFSWLLCQVLREAGFLVNYTKSCLSGWARESCGADFIGGHPVRPVFLTAPVVRLADLLSLRNRLSRWALSVGVLRLPAIDELVTKYLGPVRGVEGPLDDDNTDSWWHTPCPDKGYWSHRSMVWRHLAIITKSRVAGVANLPDSFLFRKLMAQLRPCDIPKQKWDVDTAGGSCFDVTLRGEITSSLKYRTSRDIWKSGYSGGITSVSFSFLGFLGESLDAYLRAIAESGNIRLG